MAEQTSPDKAKCADCGQPIHRTAPGTGYEWAHDRAVDLFNCPSTGMTQPADEPVKCAARIATDPDPCGCLIEQVDGQWRHIYRRVDTLHAAVPR